MRKESRSVMMVVVGVRWCGRVIMWGVRSSNSDTNPDVIIIKVQHVHIRFRFRDMCQIGVTGQIESAPHLFFFSKFTRSLLQSHPSFTISTLMNWMWQGLMRNIGVNLHRGRFFFFPWSVSERDGGRDVWGCWIPDINDIYEVWQNTRTHWLSI